ncbi:LysR family transcriptional regulator [Piscinibacter sp. HJYY11]|nr:LysR family transcriptional regulator [Piscinibacter sp. HJYY11]
MADGGSLTRASQALHTTQPTLTRQLGALERAMGAALFERTPQGMLLTAAGQSLLAPARRVQDAVQELSSTFASAMGREGGTVRIAASELVAGQLLLPALKGLRERCPDIQIELVASDEIQDLLTRQADIALRMVQPHQGSLVVRKLRILQFGLYVHRRYAEQYGVPTLSDAEDHQWIGLDRSPLLVDGFARAGMRVTAAFFDFRCDNRLVCWQAVTNALGIGIGLRNVGDADPNLVRVLEEVPLPELPLWLTTHRELRESIPLSRTFDCLAEALASP